MNKFNVFATFCALAIIATSCAREVSGDADQSEKDYLTSYNAIYGPYEQTASGMYYISRTAGTGSVYPENGQFAFIRYTFRNMNGAISSTSYDSLSRQIGAYSDTSYYGPKLVAIGNSTLYLGFEEALKGMTSGGSVKFIMPSWLSNNYEGGARSYSSPIIIEAEMVEVVPDIAKWQTDTLEHFRDKYFPGLDSTAYNFYCTVNATDTANASDTLEINYVGYLLDGTVFDTNIADTAIYHNIYNSSRTYSAMTVVKSEMSFVEGFKKALNQMADGDKANTFFSSDFGYGTTGRGGKIQAYSPLRFYIELKIKRHID